MSLAPGARLGGYEVLGPLGAGGMGEVYKARDVRLDRFVALKVLGAARSGDATYLRRFEEEARSASVLNHKNIVTIYAVGEDGDVAYIAMELVQGRTLRERLGGHPLSERAALGIAVQLAEALAAAHDAGIVHRDLKPDNIMLTADDTVKVLDFGLARRHAPTAALDDHLVTHAALTLDGTILGTVGYMSPEQAAGRAAHAPSDQFSFGLVLHEMLTGRRAFERGTAVETLSAIIREQPPSIQPRHSALQQVIDRCLVKDPLGRYPDTHQLAADVRRIWEGTGEARPTAAPAITRRHLLWLGAAATAVAAGLAGWKLRPTGSQLRALAVLPFANGTTDGDAADAEYLSDGITESLIRRVSRIDSLRVMARSTVFYFKGRSIDPREIGRQLRVDVILTGRVTRHANRLVVSAELVDVATGAQLWGNRYDRAMSDVLSVQDEIATAIVDEGIRLRPSGEERRRLARRPTEDSTAYELYLRGRHAMLADTEDGYVTGRDLLQQAVARDQTFALAYVALSTTYALMAVDGYERPTVAWPDANRHIRRALELDRDLADAQASEADWAFFFNWQWAAAEREWEAILQSNANLVDVEVLRPYALECWALGRPADALRVTRWMRERDPVSIAYRVNEADYLVQAGQFEAAVALYERIVREDPSDPRAYFGLAEAHRAAHRFDEAIEARRRGLAAGGDDSLSDVLARARGEAGWTQVDQQAAALQLEGLASRAKAGAYVSPLDFARAHAQRGDAERAFSYFEAAFADRAPGLVFLNVDRSWDAIRADARFVNAVRRVGLPVIPSSP